MAKFEVRSNIADALGFTGRLFYDQIPFATARALTSTAKLAQSEIIAQMKTQFDRPTPYTLGSTRAIPATKQQLAARVDLKDENRNGIAATKYLAPEVYGGERGMKRFERALQSRGLLPAGMTAVPGGAAQLDQYGNVSRGLIVEILSYLDAFGGQGYKANMTQRRRDRLLKGKAGQRGYSYFVLREREGKLPPGIYKRMTYGNDSRIAHLAHGAAKPVFVFVRQPAYRVRLPFEEIAQRVAQEQFEGEFRKAFDEAIATAR